VEDIMRDRQYTTYHTLSLLLDECSDELEALLAEEVGERTAIERIRQRIGDMFGPKEIKISEINLDGYVQERLAVLQPQFSHRRLEIMTDLQPVPSICIPSDVLQKVVDGLIKNALENTPDGGRLEVAVKKGGEGTELVVHDYGVGITEEGQRRIFEGFFSTQDTMAYSSKRPFDFNAGGSGADLLRMKIFAERYNFRIDMVSSRCGYIPKDDDICPGRISRCSFCKKKRDCHLSGGTAFTVFFPPAQEEGCSKEDEP
jgi:signal transduction histidine kinase